LFTLVEAQSNLPNACEFETGRCVHLECLDLVPDLGVASLLASCGQSHINTRLVSGLARYLKDVLITDADELIGILTQDEIPTPDCLGIGVEMLRNLLHEHGDDWFRRHLEDVHRTLRSREIGDWLSTQRLKYSKDLVNCVLSIYGTSIIQGRGSELSIVGRLYEEIKRSRPDIVGFSIKGQLGVLSDPFFRAVSQRVKDELDVPIIVGGQFTTGRPVERLHSSHTLSFENIDYLVRDNADLSLPELIHVIEDGKKPSNVPNVSYRENGKIVSNRIEVISDLNALPIPDFSQFDLDALPVRILPILTARGCPWRRCAFCSHYTNYGDYYVCLSIDKVIQTIKEYREKYRTHFIVFRDETLPSERARQISSSLIQEEIDDIYISTYGRMDRGYSRDVLGLMFKAGFRAISWGLESGCQLILDSMNKGTETKIMSRVLRDSHEAGIANYCFVMLGFPGEGRKEAMETFTFLNRNKDYVDLINLSKFSLSEMSPIERNPARWGVVIDEHGYHIEKGLQRNEVDELANEMYKQLPSIVSDRFTDWWRSGALPDYYYRDLLFILHSKGLLSDGYVQIAIADRRTWHMLFPIFTGYSSYNVVNDFEDAFCSLADGRNSLDSILSSHKKTEPFKSENEIVRDMRTLIDGLMKNHFVNFFSKGFGSGEISNAKLTSTPAK
jgi:radical SAM superfamily enzyme YgiQ (UPF0313 family)